MLSIFACPAGEKWGNTDFVCFEGTHLAWLLIVLILLPSFAAFSLTVTSVFFERDWRSKSVVSKSHGRSDVIILFTQLVTVLIFTLQESLSVWVLRIVVLLAGICVFAAVMHTLPFHKPAMNAYRAATAAIFLWASVAANVKALMTYPEAAAYLFWLGLPIIIVGASQSVYMQLDRFSSPNAVCKNPYHSEIRVRQLHDIGLRQHELTKRLKRETTTNQLSNMLDDSTKQVRGNDESETAQDGRVTALVEAVYIRSVETMSANSILYLFYAQYLHSLGGGKHRQKESLMLNKAEQKSPAFDVSFLIWQRRKQMEEDDTAAEQGHMNVLTRVAFDKHMKDALNIGALARKHLVLFWTELKSKLPDLGRLYELGGTLNDSISKTESAFGSLLNINRRNVDVLRKYAGFVEDVLNHPSRAQVLLDEAASIEERSTKLTKLKHSTFNFGATADSAQFSPDLEAGVYTMAHMGPNAGRIIAMNAAAGRQTGFQDSDLLGREAGMLFPTPFDKWFNAVTFEALGDGTGGDGTFLDQLSDQDAWHFMLMLNSQMFLIPVAASVRWNADGINAVTYRVNSSKGFMLVHVQAAKQTDLDDAHGEAVSKAAVVLLACCEKSLELIGLSDLSSGGRLPGCHDLLPLAVHATLPGLAEVSISALRDKGLGTPAPGKHVKVSKLLQQHTQRVIPGSHLPINGSKISSAASAARKVKQVEIDLHSVCSHMESESYFIISWVPKRETIETRNTKFIRSSLSKLSSLRAVSEENGMPLAVQAVSMASSPATRPNHFDRAQTLPTKSITEALTSANDMNSINALSIQAANSASGFDLSGDSGRQERSLSNDSSDHTGSIRIDSFSAIEQKQGAQSSRDFLSKRENTTASLAAESDGGSTTSNKSSFSTLRRLLTQRSKHIDPKLKFLRSAFFYIFIFAASAFVTNTVLVRAVGQGASAALELARDTAKRLDLLQTAATSCQVLAITGNGAISYDAEAVGIRLAQLNDLASTLEAMNLKLYEAHSTSLPADKHFSHYHSTESVELKTASLLMASGSGGQTFGYSTRRMSLLGAAAAYVGALKTLSLANSTLFDSTARVNFEIEREELQALYLILGSSDGLYAAMDATHTSQIDVAEAAVSQLIQIPAESVLICAIVFDILMVSLIAPTIQSLEETKDNVLKTFLFLPRKLVLRVHTESSKRLIRAQREARDDHGSSDESVDEADTAFKLSEDGALERSNESAARQQSLARTNSKLHIMQQKSSLWDTVQVRRHTKSLRVFLVLMTRFSAPILLLLAYLAGSYAYQRFEMDNLRSISTQVSMTDSRLLETRSLSQHIIASIFPRESLFSGFLSGQASHHNITTLEAPMSETLHVLAAIQKSSQDLLFGDEVLGLRASVTTAFKNTATQSPAYVDMADAMRQHFLVNGCASASNRAKCTAVLSGSMGQGVTFGLNELQAQVTALLMLHASAVKAAQSNSTVVAVQVKSLLSSHPGRLVGTDTPLVLNEALEYASALYTTMLKESHSGFVSTMNVVTALLVVALFMFYALLYRPSIRQVDKDIARTTGMLLMLPMDAVSKSPVVSEMISSAVKSLKQSVSQTM